ncbi:unnamed protein product [Closterium sp. Naga37s-1]|nr:unnamed protein product [Closterium sp. Naga37s-1]
MPPKGRPAKAPVEVTPPAPDSPDVPSPDSPVSPDGVNVPRTDKIAVSGPAGKNGSGSTDNNDAVNVSLPSAAAVDAAIAGCSGLTVEEKASMQQVTGGSDEGFLEDDSDEELDIDIAKEAAFRLRFIAILLIPMALSQDVKAIIAALRVLMKKVWSSSLTENAGVTANIQEMSPGYVAKTRFCRLQISFLDERDAHHIKFHTFEYQKTNGPSVKCLWQHTEDSSYLREKSSNPLAIEVLFKRVPANIVPDVLKDLLVRFKLKMRKQSAFKDGFCFHRVAHPLTGADTDVVKGLVIQHPGDRLQLTTHLFLFLRLLTNLLAVAAASLRTSALITPILKDPAVALISTGGNREEWICTQVCCGKAKGKTFMAASDHIASASHLLNLEKLGTATKFTLDKMILSNLKKEYGV